MKFGCFLQIKVGQDDDDVDQHDDMDQENDIDQDDDMDQDDVDQEDDLESCIPSSFPGWPKCSHQLKNTILHNHRWLSDKSEDNSVFQKKSVPLFLISVDDVLMQSSDSACRATFRRWTERNNLDEKDERRFCEKKNQATQHDAKKRGQEDSPSPEW